MNTTNEKLNQVLSIIDEEYQQSNYKSYFGGFEQNACSNYLTTNGTKELHKCTTRVIKRVQDECNLIVTRTNPKCFYFKCENMYYVFDYLTLVCSIDCKNNTLNYRWDDYSATTKNHINTVLDTIGYKGLFKADIMYACYYTELLKLEKK